MCFHCVAKEAIVNLRKTDTCGTIIFHCGENFGCMEVSSFFILYFGMELISPLFGGVRCIELSVNGASAVFIAAERSRNDCSL